VQAPGQFNGVPEKVPEKAWESLGSGSTGFRREGSGAEKVPEKVPEKVCETFAQSYVRRRFRRRSGQVRINRVPEKVPKKVLEKPQQLVLPLDLVLRSSDLSKYSDSHCCHLAQALVQSHVRFNRVREKVPEKVAEKVWEAVVQSQLRFNRVPEKVLEKVWETLQRRFRRFGAEPGQDEVSEKVPEGFSGEPGQVQRGSGEGFRKALVQSRARINVPEKVPEGFGGEPGQVKRGSGEGSGEGSGRSWCGQVQRGFK